MRCDAVSTHSNTCMGLRRNGISVQPLPRCLWGHINSAALQNHQNWAGKPINIVDPNQTLPLNSCQSRPPLRSVCYASVERSPLHFLTGAVWNGVDFASSTTGAVPGKATWRYPAALECVKNKSPCAWVLGMDLEAPRGFWSLTQGNLRSPPGFSPFLTREGRQRSESPLSLPPLGLPQNPDLQ